MTDYDSFLAALEEYRHGAGATSVDIPFGEATDNLSKKHEVEAIPVRKEGKTKAYSTGCAFCISNKERPSVYRTHSIKDDEGRVTCPILRAYVCPLCSATGDNAHTIRYCQRTAVGTKTSSFLQTPRNSVGKVNRFRKF